jgi:hypothetical protein
VGTSLQCSEDYLRGALDQLLALGSLLVASVSLKFEQDHAATLDRLHTLGYRMLRAERRTGAQPLCEFGVEHAHAGEDRHLFRVNWFIARKVQFGLEEIRPELAAWDMSAPAARLQARQELST